MRHVWRLVKRSFWAVTQVFSRSQGGGEGEIIFPCPSFSFHSAFSRRNFFKNHFRSFTGVAYWFPPVFSGIFSPMNTCTMCRDCKNTPGIKISGIGSGSEIPDRVGSGIGHYLRSNKCLNAWMRRSCSSLEHLAESFHATTISCLGTFALCSFRILSCKIKVGEMPQQSLVAAKVNLQAPQIILMSVG